MEHREYTTKRQWRTTAAFQTFLLSVALAAFLLPGSPVIGQTGDRESVVRNYVDVTAEILNEATDVVRESESPRARVVLKKAVELHQHSLRLLDKQRFFQARQISGRARSGAQHAVKLARESFGLEEQARTRLERFREFHDQLAERIQESDDRQAQHFLREAQRQALKAHEQFRQHNYDLVLSLIEPAEALLKRVARLLFEGGGEQRLENDFERTRELIDRAIAVVGGQSTAGSADFLARAEEAFVRAREFQAQRAPLRALHALQLARRLAGQAITQVGGDTIDADAVRQQIERWDQRAETVAEAVRESAANRAQRLYRQAADHRDRAQRLLDADDLDAALRQIKIAHELLNEAGELAR